LPPTSRQRAALHRLIGRLTQKEWFQAAILVGSLAGEVDDELSDVDLLVVVTAFPQAWRERQDLPDSDVIVAWDTPPVQDRVGAHKWITRDLVLVECLLGELGAFRLAEPFKFVAGGEEVLDRVPRRPTLTRDQVRGGPEVDPIERTYDEFKAAVRARRAASQVARDSNV
jgi:hypothetical protein